MLKSILLLVLGVVVGVIATGLVAAGIEWAGHLVYPPPAGLDPRNPEQLRQLLEQQPVGALVVVVMSWIGGAYIGGLAAAGISRPWPRTAAVGVGLVIVAAVVAMQREMPGQPMWMVLAGLLLPVPAALFAAWPLSQPRAGAKAR